MFKPTSRVLIIDDMMMMRKLVNKNLNDLGFKDIQEAADGEAGWKILNEPSPPIEIIISDWNMPILTGLELLKRVRADDKFKSLPFIMLTAEKEPHQVLEAFQNGVDNYILKPFTADNLKEKLEQTYKRLAG